MSETVLLGRGRGIFESSWQEWQLGLAGMPAEMQELLNFMSGEHHGVRNFVVTEIPRIGAPISPEHISAALGLPLPRVNAILQDLEENLFFLVRNSAGAVSWAFPVTSERTGHSIFFPGGERIDAA